MHVVLMCAPHLYSSSSSGDTPVVNAYELRARDPDGKDDAAVDDSRSVSSKQNVAPVSSPIEMSDEHVSQFDHNYPVAPEPRVNYL